MKTASKPIGIAFLVLGVSSIVVTSVVSVLLDFDTVASFFASTLSASLFCFVPGILFLRFARIKPGEPFFPSDWVFYLSLWILGGTYLLLIITLLIADLSFARPDQFLQGLAAPGADVLWGGMGLQKLLPTEQQKAGISEQTGLVVLDLEPHSRADVAGIHRHDVLVKINNQPVPGDPAKFMKLIMEPADSTRFDVELLRAGQRRTLVQVPMPSVAELPPFHFSEQIKYAIILSMISCSVTAILSLWVGVPMGYLLARTQFWGKTLVDTLLDIPIVLPPLVIGLSLLILFQTRVGRMFEENFFTVTYAVPSVILAQFTVAAAFAVRTMRVTFEQISPRTEQVAMTLGCTRAQAFWRVVLPEAWRGVLTAGTLSWARSLGEFGPILIFSGATRMRTEVLPTTVFLELSVGRIEAAIAVSLLMIAAAVIVLILTRTFGLRGTGVV
jgi:molybdate transport system permease protein